MSSERKKLIYISLAACLFVLVIAAAGFFVFMPKKGAAGAPATPGNTAAPKAADPQDYLLNPQPSPSFEPPKSPGDDLIIVYGDKPASLGTGSAGTLNAPGAVAASGTQPAGAATVPGGAATVLGGAAAGEGAASPSATSATATSAAAKSTAPKPAAAKPAAAKPSVAKPAPAKEASTKTGAAKVKVDEYWIQAASFSSRGRADELKEAIAQKGIASLISVTDVDGKSFYRVRIGPYSAKVEAEGWLGNLKALAGCEGAYVTKKTVERAK